MPPGDYLEFTVSASTPLWSETSHVILPVQYAPSPALSVYASETSVDVFQGDSCRVIFSASPIAAEQWQISSGELPSGLSLGNDGILSGMVAADATPGNYFLTVTGIASGMDPGHISFSLQVLPSTLHPTRDLDGDGLSAGLEHELSQEAGFELSDSNPTTQGYHDWLVYYFFRLAPSDTDADGDGVGDQLEQMFFQTDPQSPITAPSHTPDVIRLWLAYGQFVWDTATDSDGDGLPDSLENLLGLNTSQADTDGDGLDDTAEANLGGWFAFGTDPNVADTDLDGLPDGYEHTIGTDPRRVDTDGDHLTDYEEAQGIFGLFNPQLYDTDDDGIPDFAEADLTDSDGGGIPDRLELHWGMDPQDARDEAWDVDSNGVSNRDSYLNGWDIYAQWTPQFDDDNDGMTNVYETARGLNPADPTDGADDPDGDFLTNAEEARAHTSPFQAMTPGFENTTINELDVYGNTTSTRQAQNDYEAATSHSLRPPLPGLPALARDNGPLSGRQHEDDWDGDSISNLDELYPTSGPAKDPRVYNAQENPLSISLGSGSTQVIQGGEVSLSFTAQGGAPPYHSWGLDWQGTAPEGLFWDSASLTLTGQALVEGTHAFTIYASDTLGSTASLPLTLTVVQPPPPPELQITTSGLPTAVLGRAYGTSLQTTGAQDGIAGWTVSDGQLPPGLTLSDWGGISGTADGEPGSYSFSVQVTDGAGRSAAVSLAITVVQPEEPPPPPPPPPTPLAIQTSRLPILNAGTPYRFTPTATGGSGTYQWQISSGNLPMGLVMSSQTGEISGRVEIREGEPNREIQMDLRVIDSSGAMAQQTLVLPIQHQAPSVISPVRFYWPVGTEASSISFQGIGGFQPYTWKLEGGQLPPGVQLLPSGALSGPRPATGAFGFSVSLTDQYGQEATSSQAHQIILNTDTPPPTENDPDTPDNPGNPGSGGDNPPERLRITTTSLPQVKVGESINTTITATGGKGTYRFSGSGRGFSGLDVATNGLLTYTATHSGNFSATVSVTDSSGEGASQILSFTVEEAEDEDEESEGPGVTGPGNGSNDGDSNCMPDDPPDDNTPEPEETEDKKRDVSISLKTEPVGRDYMIYSKPNGQTEWRATLDLKGEIQVEGTEEPDEPPEPYSFWIEEAIPGTAITWTTPNNLPFRQGNTLNVKLVLTGKPQNPEDYGEKTIRVRGPGGEASLKFRLLPVDLDIVHPATGELDEGKQHDASKGGYVAIRRDDKTPVTKLLLRAGGGVSGMKYKVKFNGADKFKLWKDEARTQAVVSQQTEFDPTQETTLYFEGLKKSASVGGETLTLQAVINGTSTDAEMIYATVVEAEFDVWLNVFIPPQWVDVPPGPITGNPVPELSSTIASGDDRSFVNTFLDNPSADVDKVATSSRSHTQVTIIPFKDLDADGIKDQTEKHAMGISHNYVKVWSVPHPGDPYSAANRLLPQPWTVSTGRGLTTGMHVTPGTRDDYSMKFRFNGTADNPIVTPSAAIDWDFELQVFVDAANVTQPKWKLLGQWQDGFPGYEIYVRDSDGTGGNNKGHPIYQFDPIAVGNSPFDLFPVFGDETITPANGTIP